MKKLAIMIFGVFAFATSAQAVVYDFTAEGNATEAGYVSFNTGTDSTTAMPGGLIATGSNSGDDDLQQYAYLDSGGAGLGVCMDLNASDQCVPSDDDNVTAGDVLTLTFISPMNVLGMTFVGLVDGNHGPVVGTNSVDYRIDGGLWMDDTFDNLATLALGLLTTLDLRVNAADGQQFYLATLTAVPVPAAVWLFGTAILGLMGMRRKSKGAALAA